MKKEILKIASNLLAGIQTKEVNESNDNVRITEEDFLEFFVNLDKLTNEDLSDISRTDLENFDIEDFSIWLTNTINKIKEDLGLIKEQNNQEDNYEYNYEDSYIMDSFYTSIKEK